jgi:hypothetical protein
MAPIRRRLFRIRRAGFKLPSTPGEELLWKCRRDVSESERNLSELRTAAEEIVASGSSRIADFSASRLV